MPSSHMPLLSLAKLYLRHANKRQLFLIDYLFQICALRRYSRFVCGLSLTF